MKARRWSALFNSPTGIAALGLALILAVLAIGAPIGWGTAADVPNTSALSQPPTAAHPFGTDTLGHDILLRVLVATRLSVGLALASAALSVLVGSILGVLPTILGNRVGRLVAAGIDIAVAFPGLLLALAFATIFGVGAQGVLIALGLAGAPAFARLVHTNATAIGGRDYVAAARVAGVSRGRIVRRHILPNIGEPLIVNATVLAGTALLSFAALSFLGLGVQAPSYDWGRLLGDGLGRIYLNPIGAIGPGVAVVLAGLTFSLLGEAFARVVGLRVMERTPPAEPVAGGDLIATVDEVESSGPVLDVRDLMVSLPVGHIWVRVVDGVSFAIEAGEAVGMVGESGSGKSMTALAVAGLAPEKAVVTADRAAFIGTGVLGAGDEDRRRLLGTSLAMVFQDPMSSFNPSMRVGWQLAEVARAHLGASRKTAWERAVDRLGAVRLSDPPRRAGQYPHEFSGGMRQRAMIGMGLMGDPKLIIADEPTTALDATVQRQVLEVLNQVRRERNAALLLISHDISLVSAHCDRVLVVYAGRIVEDLPAPDLARGARHPYTRALMASVPDFSTDRDRPLATIAGRPPEPVARRVGCAFAPRCPAAVDRCHTDTPTLSVGSSIVDGAGTHRFACWNPGKVMS